MALRALLLAVTLAAMRHRCVHLEKYLSGASRNLSFGLPVGLSVLLAAELGYDSGDFEAVAKAEFMLAL